MKLEKIKKRLLIFLILAAGIYGSLLAFTDFSKIYSNLDTFSFEYYPLIFGLLAFNITIYGFRFHLLLKKIGVKISFSQSLLVYIAGLSMVFTPGGSGAIIKSHIIKKISGTSYSTTSPVIIFEKWTELVSIVIIIAILLIWSSFIESQIVVVIGSILILLSLLILKNFRFLKLFNSILKKLNLSRFTVTIEEFNSSIKKITGFKIGFTTLGLSMLTKLNGILMIYFIFKSFNLDFNIPEAGQIHFTSALIGLLTIIPGGIIVIESSMIGLLMKENVEFSIAVIAVIVSRFVGLWIPMLIGFVTLKILNKKINS